MRKAANDQSFQTDLWLICRNDIEFFIDSFVWTRDPRRMKGIGVVSPMILWPVQVLALKEFTTALHGSQDVVIEKSRDMGASWCCLIWMLWRWLFYRDQSLLLFSRKKDLVDGSQDSLFGHIDFVIKHMPPWLLPRLGRKQMQLRNEENNSVIEGETTNENVGRGGRRTALLWDEAAAFERGGYDVDASTQDTTDTRIVNSTPMGRNTAFYDLIETGQKTGVVRVVRMHWSQHPRKAAGLYRPNPNGAPDILDKDYLFPPGYQFSQKMPRSKEGVRSPWYDKQEKRRAANPQLFAREVDIDHAGAVKTFVDGQWLDDYISQYCSEHKHQGEIRPKDDTNEGWEFSPHTQGSLKVYIPLDERNGFRPPLDREYIVACDIGAGSGRSDSVAVVVDRFSRTVVAVFASATLGVDEFSRAVMGVCRMFHAAASDRWPLLIWEANGPGGNFKRRVMGEKWRYRNVYTRKVDKRLVTKFTDEPGWTSTTDSKNHMLDNLRAAMSDEECPFICPCIEAMEEMGAYIYEGEKIVHPSSTQRDVTALANDYGRNHGDRVIAMALAVEELGPSRGMNPPASRMQAAPGSLLELMRRQAAEAANG